MLQKLNLSLSSNKNSAEHGYYLLMEDITQESIKPLIEYIFDANLSEEKPKLINLIICSPGGDLTAAFAAVDVMKGSAIPIRTIGLGQIASAGLMIFLSGQKGMRILTPNTSIMSHSFSWGFGGKHHELLAAGTEINLTAERIMRLYKKQTGMNEEKIKELLLPTHDVWLSSEQAKKYGICDEVKDLN